MAEQVEKQEVIKKPRRISHRDGSRKIRLDRTWQSGLLLWQFGVALTGIGSSCFTWFKVVNKVPWFGRKERTGVGAPLAIAGAQAGVPVGVALTQFLSSPKGAVRLSQLANGLDKLTTGPILDKLIAAVEARSASQVAQWLDGNGLDD